VTNSSLTTITCLKLIAMEVLDSFKFNSNASSHVKTLLKGQCHGCKEAISEGGVDCKRPVCFVWVVITLLLGS
jgi:hypothetical protein